MRFEEPVLLDPRVTEVLYLPQHCCHEGGAQLPCICVHSLSLFISEGFSFPRVIVKGRQVIKEATAAFHIPVCIYHYERL